MYRKISGFFTPEKNTAQFAFLPGVRIEYKDAQLILSGKSVPSGTPWPGTARQRRIIQALDEKNIELMNYVAPVRNCEGTGSFVLVITPREQCRALQWEFELESGSMKIFERGNLEILFSANSSTPDHILFFCSSGEIECRLLSENWILRKEKNIFCCGEKDFFAANSVDFETMWQKNEKFNHSRWSEIGLAVAGLPLSDSEKQLLVSDLNLLFTAPEKIFFFDGNFSCWCGALRKLKLGDILKARLMQICRLTPFLQFNAKCFTGIDDGLRLPRRCDEKGCPLELNWLIALDASYSCLCACEMFEYCNTLHDMEFLEKYVFDFMKKVMRAAELSIIPDNYQLQLPYAPLPGGKIGDVSNFGKNIDRQLFYLHALAEKLQKAADMLQVKGDPVWKDIQERLPKARGNWELAPDTEWGSAGKRIIEMRY